MKVTRHFFFTKTLKRQYGSGAIITKGFYQCDFVGSWDRVAKYKQIETAISAMLNGFAESQSRRDAVSLLQKQHLPCREQAYVITESMRFDISPLERLQIEIILRCWIKVVNTFIFRFRRLINSLLLRLDRGN